MTILGSWPDHTARACFLLRQVNKQGTFDNLGDTARGLQEILGESFRHVVDVDGSVARFMAVCPS